jgi:hypothetical protein
VLQGHALLESIDQQDPGALIRQTEHGAETVAPWRPVIPLTEVAVNPFDELPQGDRKEASIPRWRSPAHSWRRNSLARTSWK